MKTWSCISLFSLIWVGVCIEQRAEPGVALWRLSQGWSREGSQYVGLSFVIRKVTGGRCHVLGSSGCYNKVPQTGGVGSAQTAEIFSHNSEGWEGWDQSASKFRFWWELFSWRAESASVCPHLGEKEQVLSTSSPYKDTNPITGDPPSSVQFSSVTQSCLTLCDPMDCSMPGLPVHHQFLEFTHTHVHWVGDAIQPSHPLHPLLLPPSIFPSIRIFSNESVLRIRWPKDWSFSFSISPSNGYSRLISFRVDWLDLLAVQGTLKSLLQHHSSKASVLLCSAFFMGQLSHPYMTTGKTKYSCLENPMVGGTW